ncbi:hypothetical protein BURK2_03556 [Burkholderiales bacterium]|nr:hypothetical protein BURK2_03556 [Burkholderiales bacterium]
MRSAVLMVGALAIGGMGAADALAAPDEIQVYTEEINDPGEFGLEQHLNYTIKGEKTESYPGQMVSHHVTQVTPEFSYGITNTLEAGLYVPVAFTPDGSAFLNGLRLRLKYIAPRQNDDAFFYGLNVEVGRDSRRTSESISGMEFRPIVGYRNADWLVSFNPILNLALAANVSHQPQFEPALKLTHSVGKGIGAGFEYYGEFGSLSHLLPSSERAHTLYAVLDVETHGFDINFGIGRGFVNAGDDWVMKGIIALPFK